MKRFFILMLLFGALALFPEAQMRLQPAPPPAAKLIRAGRVLDVSSGSYLLNQGIRAEGERIKTIGADVSAHAPGDVVMIDLGQAALFPGLVDCHALLLISGDLGRLDPGELLATTITQMSESFRALLGARNARERLDAVRDGRRFARKRRSRKEVNPRASLVASRLEAVFLTRL